LVHDRTSDLVIIAWRRPSPVRLSLPPAAAISICISARILRSVIRATPTGDVHIPPAGTDGPRRTRRGEGTRRTLGTGQISLGAGGDLLLYEGVAEAGSLSNGGTLSPRQLAASLSPRKTALRREQRQRHSSFLFRFRLFRLFSFPIGSSLTFRHNFFLSISFRK
jgi:hypothetical protein